MSNVADKWLNFTDAGLKYYPIPVLWPCNEKSCFLSRYRFDQEFFSQRAGAEFKAIVDAIPNDLFPRKSLLMHSMGNHVVFNGACGGKDEEGKVVDKAPDVEFENIFVVAAVSTVQSCLFFIFAMHTRGIVFTVYVYHFLLCRMSLMTSSGLNHTNTTAAVVVVIKRGGKDFSVRRSKRHPTFSRC